MVLRLGDIRVDNGNGNGSNSSDAEVACTPVPCLSAVVSTARGRLAVTCVPNAQTANCLKSQAGKVQPCPPCYVLIGGQCSGRASNYDDCIKALGSSDTSTGQPPTGNAHQALDECTKKILLVGGIGLAALILLFALTD